MVSPSTPPPLSVGRRIAVFVAACGLLGGGGYVIGVQVLVVQGVFWRALLAGAFMVALGGYLLWEDILRPIVGATARH